MKVVAVFLVLVGVVGCEVAREPLYRIARDRVFLYDNSALDNVRYYAGAGTAVPICDRRNEWVKLCLPAPFGELFGHNEGFVPATELSTDLKWRLRVVEVNGAQIDFFFLPPFDGAVDDLHPLAVVVAGQNGAGLRVAFTPAVPAVQFSFRRPTGARFRLEDWYGVRDHHVVAQLDGAVPWGFKTEWISPTQFRITAREPDFEDLKIVLDPGHGHNELGACRAGLCEKNLALTAAQVMRERLVEHGYSVSLTRDGDDPLTLRERVLLSEEANADLFVSIHFDSWGTKQTGAPDVGGLMCYYQRPFARYFAEELCRRVAETGRRASWSVRRSLYVLHSRNMPSILLELGDLLITPERQRVLDPVASKAYYEEVADQLHAVIGAARPK